MYKHILVPLDGSKFSEAILPEVERLVSGTDARVTLLTVAEVPEAFVEGALESYGPLTWPFVLAPAAVRATLSARSQESTAQALKGIYDEAEAYLTEKARLFRDRSIQAECEVWFGDPAHGILKYVEDHEVDLIAMTTHGRSGLARLVFGSVASRVLQSGAKPLLLVRPHGLRATAEKEEKRR